MVATITAVADAYTVSFAGGDWATTQNVMANDLNLTSSVLLWSVDDGTQNQVTLKPANGLTDMDLATQDAIGVDNVSSGGALHLTGGEVKIDTRTGSITYDVIIESALYNYMAGLSDGETYKDTFAYAIRYANALTGSQATVQLTLAGHNWDPQISHADSSGLVTEDLQ